jgi:hypothetical protein
VSAHYEFERIDLGTVGISAQDLARIDAAATAQGASRAGVIHMLIRNAARALPAPGGTP